MEAGGLLHLWNKWGIQILVLASFALQVFLLVFGGTRRRKSSAMLRLSLWLAYLLADSTAIYALGHLSIGSGTREPQLVAFWVPFLLLHLGGPDNITAYALEDNRLWLRHLQTLTVQVLGAAYVIYNYIANSEPFLLVASSSMFVAGVVKYGERIWALRCGNMSRFSKSNDVVDPCQLLRQGMGEEEILLRAHSQFDICKCAFTDTKLEVSPKRSSNGDDRIGSSVGSESIPPKAYMDEDIYKLLEMELSLMYDMLYTKAMVIHTWYGFCIHFISLLGTATTFLLFQLGSRNGHSRVDVVISYVLLVGASVLEAISLCRALLSTWSCASLSRRGWNCLLDAITSLRRLFIKPARRRLWSGCIGQYNLFHLCTRDSNEIGNRLATKLGLHNWWNKLHFSGTFSDTTSFSTEDLKEHILQALQRLKDDRTNLNRSGAFIKDLLKKLVAVGAYDDPHWSDDIDFDESIIVLHTATDVYIQESPAAHEEKFIEVIKVISNYMMFLLVLKPEMLPGRPRHKVFVDACKFLDEHWSQCLDDGAVITSSQSWNPYNMLKELFHHEGPNNGSRILLREKLADKLYSKYKDDNVWEKYVAWDDEQGARFRKWSSEYIGEYGFLLAKELLEMDSIRRHGDAFAAILECWLRMMLHAAERCSRDSHARQLSNGGEFITIVWLLEQHHIYLSQYLAA
ncbi:hypothetical protein ACP4OV_029018 [Aristida adscensionis]